MQFGLDESAEPCPQMMASMVNQAVGHKDCQNHRITEIGPVLCSVLPSTPCPTLGVRVSNHSGMFPSFLVNFRTFRILHLLCYCPLCLKWPLVPLRHLLCLRHQTTEIQIFCLPTKAQPNCCIHQGAHPPTSLTGFHPPIHSRFMELWGLPAHQD